MRSWKSGRLTGPPIPGSTEPVTTRVGFVGLGRMGLPMGANLARAELEEALAFLAPRTPDLTLDGPAQLGGVEGIYGIDKLPIAWSNHGPAPYVS